MMRSSKKVVFGGTLLFIVFSIHTFLFAEVQPDLIKELKPRLNTQRIEYFFGNSGVEILPIDSPMFTEKRVSNLYSADENHHKTMRCLAIVDFATPVHAELIEVHQSIRAGSPIGETLKQCGWDITKKPIYFSTFSLSPEVMQWMETDVNEAALHIYELRVSSLNHPQDISYCTIIEIHSPEYLTTDLLRALYSDQYETHSNRTPEIDSTLTRCNHLIQHFPSPNKD